MVGLPTFVPSYSPLYSTEVKQMYDGIACDDGMFYPYNMEKTSYIMFTDILSQG